MQTREGRAWAACGILVAIGFIGWDAPARAGRRRDGVAPIASRGAVR